MTYTTTTSQSTSSIPGWAYGAMVVLLLVGLAIGYGIRRTTAKPEMN
jgi:high-affinity Fe2+/Pb2+ permease